MDLKSWRAGSVERRAGGIHGVGLFAVEDINKNDLLAVKAGKIVDEATVIEKAEVINGSQHQIEKNLFITGLTPEEVDRTLIGYNHSCAPNAYISGQIELRAMRDIKRGEEITVDYATIFMSDTQSFKCVCGSPACRHFIKPSVDYKNPELQKKYKGYFADYIQRAIDAGN
jgi:SET domain-containing protein